MTGAPTPAPVTSRGSPTPASTPSSDRRGRVARRGRASSRATSSRTTGTATCRRRTLPDVGRGLFTQSDLVTDLSRALQGDLRRRDALGARGRDVARSRDWRCAPATPTRSSSLNAWSTSPPRCSSTHPGAVADLARGRGFRAGRAWRSSCPATRTNCRRRTIDVLADARSSSPAPARHRSLEGRHAGSAYVCRGGVCQCPSRTRRH